MPKPTLDSMSPSLPGASVARPWSIRPTSAEPGRTCSTNWEADHRGFRPLARAPNGWVAQGGLAGSGRGTEPVTRYEVCPRESRHEVCPLSVLLSAGLGETPSDS